MANLFYVHKNTVRSWVKDGLATNDDKRPMLILGSDLKDYLQRNQLNQEMLAFLCSADVYFFINLFLIT